MRTSESCTRHSRTARFTYLSRCRYAADILRPHSTSELINRLEALDLIVRRRAETDKRQMHLVLTDHAEDLLGQLSTTHREEIRRLKPLLLDLLDRLG